MTTIRICVRICYAICFAPEFVAEELLRAEGFTDVRYVHVQRPAFTQAFARGEIDFGFMFAPRGSHRLDDGVPITVLAGVHTGCFELFVHEPIRAVTDLKGKRVGVPMCGRAHLAVRLHHGGARRARPREGHRVGRRRTTVPTDGAVRRGKIDAYLAFVPEPQELRARKIGQSILNMAAGQTMVAVLLLPVGRQRGFVRKHPVATKRVLRAILKAADLCRPSRSGPHGDWSMAASQAPTITRSRR